MNKYKLLILICFFLLTISLPNVTASINNLNLLGKKIVLDAGHPRFYKPSVVMSCSK